MKKSLKLALVPAALAALASTASAQVVVAGRVDLGVLYAPLDLTKSADKVWQQAESSNARLNFSGRENLGGGLTAYFMIEHRFFADTGAITDANAFWRDKSWVGLNSTSFGDIRLGRVHSPQYGTGVAGRYEAFFGDSYASMGTRGGKSANQWSNSVYYTTPTWGGFNAGVIVQAGEAANARGEGGHLVFAQGPLSLALSYQKEQESPNSATKVVGNTIQTATFGGFYDFKVVKVMATYARSTDINAADTGEEVVYTVGARIPAGPGEIRTSFRKIDDTGITSRTNASGDKDSTRFALGYAYFLSKLTSINLSAVRENVKSFNANGTTNVERSGTGAEAALRVMF